jgi:hypothetical protein
MMFGSNPSELYTDKHKGTGLVYDNKIGSLIKNEKHFDSFRVTSFFPLAPDTSTLQNAYVTTTILIKPDS